MKLIAVRCQLTANYRKVWGKQRSQVNYYLIDGGTPVPRINAKLPYWNIKQEPRIGHGQFGTRRLRVKNAGCNEDIAVESAKF
jgi:hypothetical protein